MLVHREDWYPVFYELSKMKAENRMPMHFRIVPPNEGKVSWHFYLPLEYYNRLDLLHVWNQDIGNQENQREISCQAGIRAASICYNGDIYGCDTSCFYAREEMV